MHRGGPAALFNSFTSMIEVAIGGLCVASLKGRHEVAENLCDAFRRIAVATRNAWWPLDTRRQARCWAELRLDALNTCVLGFHFAVFPQHLAQFCSVYLSTGLYFRSGRKFQ